MAWLTGFSYRRPIYANTSTIAATSANIPLPLLLSGLVDLTGKVQADFDDAQITDTDGETLLDYYWESKVAAAAVGHLEVPSLTFGEAALLVGYLYYGNAAATDQSDEAGTFGAYSSRYGCSEASGNLADSVGGVTGVPGGTPTYEQTGQIGNCVYFDAVTDYFNLGVAANFNVYPNVPFSLELWLKTTSSGFVLMKAGGLATDKDWVLTVSFNKAVGAGFIGVGGTGSATSVISVNDGAWHHVAYVFDKPNSLGRIYVDGAADGTAAIGVGDTGATAPVVAAMNRRNGWPTPNGIVAYHDEVCIAINSVLSAPWILARYMAGAGTLWTWGAEEEAALYGAADLAAAAVLAAAGARRTFGTADLSTDAALSIDGIRRTFGASDFEAAVAMAVDGIRRAFGASDLATSVALGAEGMRKALSSADLAATVAVVAEGLRRTFGTADLAAAAELLAEGQRRGMGGAQLIASVGMLAETHRITYGSVNLAVQAILSASSVAAAIVAPKQLRRPCRSIQTLRRLIANSDL